MKKFALSLMLACTALGAAVLTARAAGRNKQDLPPCEPGFQWAQVTEMQDVCRDVCRVVPDVKKITKWVYSTIDDPFCIQHSGHLHKHDCGPDCPTCKGPYPRKQLVKRQVICEEPTTKCVVEKITEKVPCTVWRKVPCATTTPAPPVPAK